MCGPASEPDEQGFHTWEEDGGDPAVLAVLGFCARPAGPAQVRWPVMDKRPRHNHLTRDVKQDGSCPACAALLARQHGSLSAAEVERRGCLDQVPAPGHEAWLRELGDRDLHDSDVTDPVRRGDTKPCPERQRQRQAMGRLQRQTLAVAAGTVTVAGLRHVPVDIAVRSVAVWDEEFRATKGELTARKT